MTRVSPTHTAGDGALPPAARWAQLEPLLDAALALPPDARRAYLDTAVGSDAPLRAELDRLLAACERASENPSYLATPAPSRFASLWSEDPDDARFRTAIADRYDVVDEVGRGGMGIVYRAQPHHAGRAGRAGCPVALKVLRTTAATGSAARFRQEIGIAATLRHPNILPLLDAGSCDGRLWYTMPLLAGETLGARLRRDGPLPIAAVVRVLRELCAGLAHAHARDVVHRDIKPSNVLLAEGAAVIADFGIAKALAAAAHDLAHDLPGTGAAELRTATGVAVGTLAYMAPEQAVGERSIDARADLYALGALGYEVLTGVTPFTGVSRQALLTAVLAAQPAPLRARRRDVPPRLDALIQRLLTKRVSDRPASAAEVDAVLADLGHA